MLIEHGRDNSLERAVGTVVQHDRVVELTTAAITGSHEHQRSGLPEPGAGFRESDAKAMCIILREQQ